MNHSNTDTGKRVELHCHTKLGSTGAVNSAAEIIQAAKEGNMSAVAITDVGVAYAFPAAAEACKSLWSAAAKECRANGMDPGAEQDFFKVIYGMETRLLRPTPECREKGGYSIVLLAQSEIGKRNLYHLITDCSEKPAAASHPRVSEKELTNDREGLLVGSAGEDGEVFQAILAGKSEEELQRLAAFYNYLEIQPVSCDDPEIAARTQTINQKIVELGDLLHIPVIASSNAYLLDAKDALGWKLLRRLKGVETAQNLIPPHFRTMEEMLQEFQYLGDEKAAEVVITNTNRIADEIEAIRPILSGRHLLRAPCSDSTLRKVCTEKASELYGDPLPEVVASRLNRELETIIRRGYDEALLLVQKIVQKSTSNGYCVMPRSTLGASFVAYLLGIADGNPLPSHYRCTKCFYTDFESETVLQAYGGTGFDLPDKCCPCCGAPLQKDGLSIPFETFMGLNGEDNPEISINFSGEYVLEIHRYTMGLLGQDRMIREGAIRTMGRVSANTIGNPIAYDLVHDYLEDQKIHTSKQRAAQLTKLCAGTFCAHSYQPGGFFLLPEHTNVYDFTPLQRHPRRGELAFAETHFDRRALRNSFLELSELGHRTPTLLHELQALTGVNPAEIPFDDEKVLSLFSSPEALGLAAEDLLGYSAGVLGVPEFDSPFLIKLLSQVRPNRFSDLIRADALAHGCGTWEPVQELVKNHVCSFPATVCCMDDIWNELRHRGVPAETAFGVMRNVQNGRIAGETCKQWAQWTQELQAHGVPQWYLHSCEQVSYLASKAHCAAYTMATWRIAFFKLYYPLEFYTVLLNTMSDPIPSVSVYEGIESLDAYIAQQYPTSMVPEDVKLFLIQGGRLLNVREMYARGFAFCPFDRSIADAEKYKIINGKIMPPLSMFPEAKV